MIPLKQNRGLRPPLSGQHIIPVFPRIRSMTKIVIPLNQVSEALGKMLTLLITIKPQQNGAADLHQASPQKTENIVRLGIIFFSIKSIEHTGE